MSAATRQGPRQSQGRPLPPGAAAPSGDHPPRGGAGGRGGGGGKGTGAGTGGGSGSGSGSGTSSKGATSAGAGGVAAAAAAAAAPAAPSSSASPALAMDPASPLVGRGSVTAAGTAAGLAFLSSRWSAAEAAASSKGIAASGEYRLPAFDAHTRAQPFVHSHAPPIICNRRETRGAGEDDEQRFVCSHNEPAGWRWHCRWCRCRRARRRRWHTEQRLALGWCATFVIAYTTLQQLARPAAARTGVRCCVRSNMAGHSLIRRAPLRTRTYDCCSLPTPPTDPTHRHAIPCTSVLYI